MMTQKKLAKLKTMTLKEFGLDEKWLESRIVEDPNILGLPEKVFVRSKQRGQQRAGRLDVLLETEDRGKRYEVEIQLGATDPSHIIRTIEYWDLERQRFSKYEHCAVIVAEDITSRFFNVIGLFNRHLPIIAINVTAVDMSDDEVGLIFTHVLRENTPDDDIASEEVNRDFWIKEGWKSETELAEYVVRGKFKAEPNYTKFYMGMVGRRNSMIIEPRRNRILLRFRRLSQTDKWDTALQESGVEYEFRRGDYWLTMHNKSDVDKHWNVIQAMHREMEGNSQLAESSAGDSDSTNSGGDS